MGAASYQWWQLQGLDQEVKGLFKRQIWFWERSLGGRMQRDAYLKFLNDMDMKDRRTQ